MKETHIQWFQRVTRGDSNRRTAELANISNATLSRQLRAGELSADLILKIAEAYNESPVIALIDLGFISAKWMHNYGNLTTLARATDEELTDELLRRLGLLDNSPVDVLAEKRRKALAKEVEEHNDGTVLDFNTMYGGYGYAADSSTNEQDAREERNESIFD